MLEMGQRLADAGYVVLLPDLYYRVGPYAPLDPKKVFASENPMAVIGPLFQSTSPTRATEDTEAFMAYLDTRKDVAGRKIGATGYCMGGAMVLTAAGTYPDRIAAAASFHGGNLANDSETSPHRFAPRIKARVFVAGADNDPFYPPEIESNVWSGRSAKPASIIAARHIAARCTVGPWPISRSTTKRRPSVIGAIFRRCLPARWFSGSKKAGAAAMSGTCLASGATFPFCACPHCFGGMAIIAGFTAIFAAARARRKNRRLSATMKHDIASLLSPRSVAREGGLITRPVRVRVLTPNAAMGSLVGAFLSGMGQEVAAMEPVISKFQTVSVRFESLITSKRCLPNSCYLSGRWRGGNRERLRQQGVICL